MDHRHELHAILASPMLQADARTGDADARNTLDQAREEMRRLDQVEDAAGAEQGGCP